jgi:hypothetical protein
VTLASPSTAAQTRTCALSVDRFIRASFLANAEVTLADAVENIAATAKLTGGRRLPALIDLRRVRSQSADARAYLAGPDANRVSIAVALLIGTPISRVIGNFYLGVNRPTVPTRLFTELAEAERWLDQFLPSRTDGG